MLSNESREPNVGGGSGEINSSENNEVKSVTLSLVELSVLKALVKDKLSWTRDYLTYQQPSEGGTYRTSMGEITSLTDLLAKLTNI